MWGRLSQDLRLSIGLCRSEKSIHKSPLLSYCGPIYPVAVWLLNLPGGTIWMEYWRWTSLDKASNDMNNFRSTPFARFFFAIYFISQTVIDYLLLSQKFVIFFYHSTCHTIELLLWQKMYDTRFFLIIFQQKNFLKLSLDFKSRFASHDLLT